jgi:hypothetical protein
MKILLVSVGLFLAFTVSGQSTLFKQKNKILEYHYGVTDSIGMAQMSELEKIKYELTFMEKSYQKTILNDYSVVTEIIIDSNDFEQAWMNLPKRYKYHQDGVSMFDKQGNLLRTLALGPDEQEELKALKNNLAAEGYHPGLAYFPSYQVELKPILEQEGYHYEQKSNGNFILSKGTHQMTYSLGDLTIIEEFEDEDGKKNRITKVYEKMENDRGFLLKVEKHERYVNLEKGPCLTETKLKVFQQYSFEDVGSLQEKALLKNEKVSLFPNPNNGNFKVSINLRPGVSVQSAQIINLINGHITKVMVNNSKQIEVNQSDLPKGNYNFQIITSENKIINTSFIKN